MSLLQEAQVHIPAATLRAASEPHSMLVEMPANFDVTGDAGSIGLFAMQTATYGKAMMMDIKGANQHTNRKLCALGLCCLDRDHFAAAASQGKQHTYQ